MSQTLEAVYTWVDGPTCTDAEWERVEAILSSRGWASFNRPSTRIILAHSKSGELLGFNTLQLFPYVGPLWVAPSARGSDVVIELVDRMMVFLAQVQARGFLVIAQSTHTQAMCKKLGMKRVEAPVYMMGGTT